MKEKTRRHCGLQGCPGMRYVKWLLVAIEGRLRYFHDQCLAHDFDKNRRSQKVHCQTASQHYQFVHKSAGSAYNWLRSADRSRGCTRIQQELALLIEEIHGKVLSPLSQRTSTDEEAGRHIDVACDGTQEVCRRFQRLHALASENLRSFGESLADMGKGG